MRTTIDLPDNLLRRAKATAALRGIKLKEFIAGSIQAALNRATASTIPTERPKRSLPPLIAKAMTGVQIPALTKEEIAEIEMEEDLDKLRRSFGR
ncbi:MAG: hypothetical protein KGJ62_06760 [Armatimonadetes bacterium]|nr:hypothetical protein [Armatimonadota bacterium]MDE2207406.1 hypothetical protein [Armatimonadota bacterium]